MGDRRTNIYLMISNSSRLISSSHFSHWFTMNPNLPHVPSGRCLLPAQRVAGHRWHSLRSRTPSDVCRYPPLVIARHRYCRVHTGEVPGFRFLLEQSGRALPTAAACPAPAAIVVLEHRWRNIDPRLRVSERRRRRFAPALVPRLTVTSAM